MRKLQFVVCLLVFMGCTRSVFGQEPILPTSLLNWLTILDDDDYKLLSAVDQNNFYFSVRVDADGDILFASQDNLLVSRAKPRSFTLRITDLEGNDLHDMKSKKPSPKAKQINYSSNSKTGVKKSNIVSYSSGTLYPLLKHANGRVRVRYIENPDDSHSTELFNQVITLSKKRGITSKR